jgi:hypothetical protein
MEWFAVRSVFKFGEKSDGKTIYEERIVGFNGANIHDALAKAEAESEQYANESGFQLVGDLMAYQQDGEPLIDGYELFSQLFESKESPEGFYQSRYARYTYTPEEGPRSPKRIG